MGSIEVSVLSAAVNRQSVRVSWQGAKIVRSFARREDGATAVEFGLVALPFFGLLFAIIETALVFFASQVLETAAADSARLILTGQAQTTLALTKETFKEEVCKRIHGLFSCEAGVHVDVQKFPSFANVNLNNLVGPDKQFIVGPDGKPVTKYEPGDASEIVVVRLFYKWPTIVPLMGLNLDNMAGGRLVVATAAFRNEPFK